MALWWISTNGFADKFRSWMKRNLKRNGSLECHFDTNNANNNTHTYTQRMLVSLKLHKVFILTAQVTSQNNLDWVARVRLQNIIWLGHWTIKQIAPTRTINKLSLALSIWHKQTHTRTQWQWLEMEFKIVWFSTNPQFERFPFTWNFFNLY